MLRKLLFSLFLMLGFCTQEAYSLGSQEGVEITSDAFHSVTVDAVTAVSVLAYPLTIKHQVIELVVQTTATDNIVLFSTSNVAAWTQENGQCLGGAVCPGSVSIPINPLKTHVTYFFVLDSGAPGTRKLRSWLRFLPQTRP